MDVQDFVARYPKLYHLAHEGAWPGLQAHGLLSASALIDLFKVQNGHVLVTEQRLLAVPLVNPQIGTAVLRDQHTLNISKLATALTDGTSVTDWLVLLSELTFLFPTTRALDAMLRAYGHEPVVILTINTSSLVREYESSIRLTAINTGSVLYKPAKRGPGTFVGIRRFDHSKRTVKEVAIRHGIPDLLDHLRSAERRLPDGTIQALD